METITRSEAKAAGKTRYFTGRPCPRGHVAERMCASKDCVECHNARCRRSNKERPQKHRERADRWRKANPKRSAIISRRAAKKHRSKNPEKHNRLARAWRNANPEKVREQTAIWRAANIERVREGVARRTKFWRAAFPEKRRATENKRRSRKKCAEGHHTADDILRALSKQFFLCIGIDCAADISRSFTIDHIIPLSRGGSNWPHNIQLLCRSCNSKKGIRTMEEWLATSTPRPEPRSAESRSWADA